MRYEGTVMKVTEKHVVLLCPDQGFKNVPRTEGEFPRMGETYIYEEKKKLQPAYRWMAYGATACFLIVALFLVYGLVPHSQSRGAYVITMDIRKTSIEVLVNQNLVVTSLKGLNQYGDNIVSLVSYQGKSVPDTMKLIIEKCVQNQYLKPEKKGLIATTIIPLEKSHQSLPEEDIRSYLLESLASNSLFADVTVSLDTKQTLEAAQELNLSVNKYKAYNELKNKGINIPVEKVTNISLYRLLKMNIMLQQPKT